MTRADLQSARLTLRRVAPEDEGVVGVKDRALGYWLRPQRHGFSCATEAAREVLTEHFAQDPADIASGYYEGNTQSAKVLCKRGFVETGLSHCGRNLGPFHRSGCHIRRL